jgi:hypothetical protein
MRSSRSSRALRTRSDFMAHPLDAARLKLARATEHLSAFDTEQDDWQEKTELYRFEFRDHGDERSYFLEIIATPPAHLSLVLGDCVQNLRASLDYLAWQLVLANNQKPGYWTHFPIYREAKSGPFRPRCVSGMNPDAIALIEQLQPYYGGKNADTDLLWFVCELSNADKHRTINIVTGQTVVTAFRIHMDFGADDIRVLTPAWLERGVLFDGARVARYPLVGLHGGNEVRVEAEARGFMTLGKELPWGAQPVEHHIGNAWWYIRDEVLPMFDRFF